MQSVVSLRKAGPVRAVAAATIPGAAIGVSGPFGSYQALDWPVRLAYWCAVCAAGTLIALILSRSVEGVLGSSSSRWVRDLLTLLVFSLICTPVFVGFSAVVLPVASLSPSFFQKVFILVLAIWIALTVGRILLFDLNGSSAGSVAGFRPEVFRLKQRLPDDATANIIHIRSEDHYVIVRLDDGSTHRLLMRLSDAIDEMDGVEGTQVHRSHWVANSANKGFEKSEGKWIVRLSVNDVVPVGKKYHETVTALVSHFGISERDRKGP